MRVHVSIHDVSPAFEEEVAAALALCHAEGIRPALLVVPDYHERAPLTSSPTFVKRLCALAREGHEILLHGLTHSARGGSFFRQRVVSAGEAEFADLVGDEARRALQSGLDVLTQAGLAPSGFVPPAWSMRPELLPLLAEAGFRYSEDHLHVHNPSRGQSRTSLVLNYATRSPWRLLSTLAYCRIARPLSVALPVRIAIHPADMRLLLVRKELQRLLAWARTKTIVDGPDLLGG